MADAVVKKDVLYQLTLINHHIKKNRNEVENKLRFHLIYVSPLLRL